MPKELEREQEFPSQLHWVWKAFTDLDLTRTIGLNGPNPITYAEMVAYNEFCCPPITGREAETIKKLDMIYIRSLS